MKRSFYILFTLIMILILFPQSAFADEGKGSVNVTVSLPEGVTAGDGSFVEVSLIKPVDIDSNGVIQNEIEWIYTKHAYFTSGSKIVTFNNVPAGNYAIWVQPYCNSTEILGKSGYYSINGVEASSAYTVIPFTLVSGGEVSGSINLERAETSFSGEVHTTNPVTEDTYLSLYLYPSSDLNGSSSYRMEVLLPAGQNSAPFSIGLKSDSYTLEARNQSNGRDYCYSYNEEFSPDWDEQMYLDLFEASIANRVLNVDALFSESTDKVNVSITVDLPETLTQPKRYRVCVGTYDQFWQNSTNYYASAGDDSFTVNLSVEKGKPFIYAYMDSTSANGGGGNRTIGLMYASSQGITSIRANAKAYTFNDNGALTISGGDTYTIRGALNRNGFAAGYLAAGYVIAEFKNGETFVDRVVWAADENEKPFTVYVPQEYVNQEYSLYVAPAEQKLFSRIQTSSKIIIGNYTLTQNMSVGTIALDSSGGVTYTGTITLPEGIVAPEGGLAVEIDAWTINSDNSWGELGTIVIPGGSNSIEFSLVGAPGYTNYEATMIGLHPGIFETAEDHSGNTTNLSFAFAGEALIRGTVYMPDGVSGVYAGRVNGWAQYIGGYCYITIPDGSDHANYCLHVPYGQSIYGIRLEAEYASNDRILTNELYIGADWTQTDRREDIYIDGNHSGVDFHIPVAKLIGGQIVSVNGDSIDFDLSNDRNPWLYLYETGSNDWIAEAEAKLTSAGNWTAQIPESLQGDYVLQLSLNGVAPNVLYQNYYYSDGQAVTSRADADSVSIGSDDLMGIDFYVETGYVVIGRVLVPEEGYINKIGTFNGNYNLTVYFEDKSANKTYNTSVRINPASKVWEYQAVLPKQTTTYECYVRGYSNILNYYESNVYLAGKSGVVFATVTSDTSIPDITLPLLKYQLNGHIVSADGSPIEFDFSSNGALQLYLYEEGSNQTTAQFQITSLTNDSWFIMLPETFTGSYLLELGFGNITNNLMDSWYYYSLGKAARYQEDATFISFNESDVLDLDFYVETGYVITGSIVVPEEGYINKTTSNTWEQSITLYFENTDTGRSYSRSVGIQPSNKRWDYRIVLPKQNGNYEFYAEGRASLLNSYDTNVGITGKTDTLTLAVSGNTTAPDLRLPLLTRIISGRFVAEDGGSVDLDLSDGSVILTIYKGSSGYDTAGEFPVTVVDDGTWTVTVPDNLVGEYRLRMYFGNIQSNLLDNYYYYADGLAVTYTEDASALTLGDMDITSLSFYVKAGYVVTGSIVIPEDGYINRITSNNWDEYVSVIFKNLDTNNTYSTSVQIDPSSKQWHYRLIVSRESGNYKYYAEGDSYLTRYYDFNVCLNGKTNVQTVTLSSNMEVPDVRFPLLNRVIGGQFVTEAGGSVDIDPSGGSITLTIYEGSSGSNTVGAFPVSIENGSTWSATVPDNLSGEYRLRMYFNGVQSNLLDTTYFYAEDHVVTYLDDASVVTVSDEELTNLTFYVTAGYIVTGSIVIPEDEYITETSTNNWYRNVYVRFRNVDTGNSYSTGVAIDPTSKRWDYRIVIPQQSGEYEYYAYGDSYTLQYYDTNVCLNGKTNVQTVTLSDNTAVDDLRFPLLAREISGQFVSADGDTVDVDVADGYVRLTLYQGSSGYTTVGEYPVTVTDGNVWSVTVPDNLTGEYRLYLYFNGVQSNLLNTSYYYAEGQAVTSMSYASVITIGDEDIEDLAFYVTTGYVVTGNVCIPEGGYINKINQNSSNRSVSVQLSNTDSYNSYSASAMIDPSSNSWTYRVVLPKQSATYQYYAYGSTNLMKYYDTNVWLTGQTNTVTVTIDQSMALDNLIFPLIKATITGTVSRPSDVSGYLYYNVCVKTDNGTYNRSYEIYSDQSAATYAITVPDTDTAESYQLYYTASTNTLRNGPMYLKEDGSLTETQTEACDFVFTDTVHDFTLVPLYPCLEGHFYIPDSIPDGAYVYVQVGVEYYNESYGYYDSATTSFNVQVGSDLKTDIKGRYVEYSLRAQNLKVDQPFYVKFYAEHDSLNNKWFYVDIDNYVSVQRGETPDYVYDGVNPAIVDLVAQTWDDGNHYIFESAHGLSSGSATYTYSFPGTCSSLTLHFAELSTDRIWINNRYYYPTGGDTYTISGNSVSISVDYNYSRRYGFAIDEITPNNVTVDTPGIAAVYTESQGDSVISMLKIMNELEATVYTGDLAPGTVLIGQAVLYDADNQFIGVASAQPVTVESEKNIPLHFNFDEVSGETASVAVLFLDEDLAPLSEEYVTYY